MLTDREEAFLERREVLVGAWPFLGAGLLACLVGLGGWLAATRPLLVNPMVVAERLRSAALPESTAQASALLLPVVLCMLLVVVAILVGLGFAVAANERRYIAIIGRLRESESVR